MFDRSAPPYENIGRVLFFCFAVLLLVGCPTPPKNTGRVTPLSAPGGFIPRSEQQLSTEPAPPLVNLPGEPSFAPAQDRHDPILPEETFQIPTGLIPLNAWAQLCGFNDLRVVPDATPYTVDLTGDSGVLTLVLGQRFAKWNGINVGLGFGPATRQGQMVVHSIDVLKSFYPLALGTFSIPKPVRLLVLDPGHGGSDPGSLTTDKTYEKDLTLDWALRVEKILAGTSWKVILTRRDDLDHTLMERVAIADRLNADIFISLHFNSLEKSGARDENGIETFCLTPAGAPSNVTRGFDDDVRRYFPNNEFDSANILLASRIQDSLVKISGRRDRGVRRARFMTVLREQRRPAVLVEGGFLSSAIEGKLILDPAYREQIAIGLCNALPN
ncbi:MAG: N-acetylmuramoyl-L-alanine amidase family protein [Limisphaerales bacterium]